MIKLILVRLIKIKMKKTTQFLSTTLITNFLFFANKVSAEFQEIQTTKEAAELPTAEFLNRALHYTNVGIAFVFILFLLLMLAAGIEFLMAGGDEGSLQDAHRMWRIASIGLVSALLGYIVVNLIKFFI
jgi:hypothetical protein